MYARILFAFIYCITHERRQVDGTLAILIVLKKVFIFNCSNKLLCKKNQIYNYKWRITFYNERHKFFSNKLRNFNKNCMSFKDGFFLTKCSNCSKIYREQMSNFQLHLKNYVLVWKVQHFLAINCAIRIRYWLKFAPGVKWSLFNKIHQ